MNDLKNESEFVVLGFWGCKQELKVYSNKSMLNFLRHFLLIIPISDGVDLLKMARDSNNITKSQSHLIENVFIISVIWIELF